MCGILTPHSYSSRTHSHMAEYHDFSIMSSALVFFNSLLSSPVGVVSEGVGARVRVRVQGLTDQHRR